MRTLSLFILIFVHYTASCIMALPPSPRPISLRELDETIRTVESCFEITLRSIAHRSTSTDDTPPDDTDTPSAQELFHRYCAKHHDLATRQRTRAVRRISTIPTKNTQNKYRQRIAALNSWRRRLKVCLLIFIKCQADLKKLEEFSVSINDIQEVLNTVSYQYFRSQFYTPRSTLKKLRTCNQFAQKILVELQQKKELYCGYYSSLTHMFDHRITLLQNLISEIDEYDAVLTEYIENNARNNEITHEITTASDESAVWYGSKIFE